MTVKELERKIKEAAKAYYDAESTISDKEYDELVAQYEELTGSPYESVGADTGSDLKKVKHEYKALSLDKTKDAMLIVKHMLKGAATRVIQEIIVMPKMDGSTLQLTYNNGKLEQAITRGDGEIGGDVTFHVPYIKGIPQNIDFKGKLVVRGEVVMSWQEFERINANLPANAEHYKHPRNLATGTLNSKTNEDISVRDIRFKAFDLVYSDSPIARFDERFTFLQSQGISIVPYQVVSNTASDLAEAIVRWTKDAEAGNFEDPLDGLVIALNDQEYAESLPGTEHHPNRLKGFALKWEDETVETVLLNIVWQVGRTGLITPVAEFKPVELEGSTVSRATLHNLDFIKSKDLKIGDRITVYKANKIIPAVDANLDSDQKIIDQPMKWNNVSFDNRYEIPTKCPVCGETTYIQESEGGTHTLICVNPHCTAKKLQKFIHFGERDCMNLKGLSEKKIEFLLSCKYISQLGDLYKLSRKPNILQELRQTPGWGDSSVDNLLQTIEASRKCSFVGFIHAMGIPNIGKGQAKLLKKHLDKIYSDYEEELNDLEMSDSSYDLMGLLFLLECNYDYDFRIIEGFGDVINTSLKDWIAMYLVTPRPEEIENDENIVEVLNLLDELSFTDRRPEMSSGTASLEGKTFVITGAVNHFKNRDEVKEKIESLGGKVTGSVSKNTDYLINNDVTSTSGKNKKAQDLNIPIISEEDFLKMI